MQETNAGQSKPLQRFNVDGVINGRIILSQEVLAEDADKARDKFLTDLPRTLKFKVSKKY